MSKDESVRIVGKVVRVRYGESQEELALQIGTVTEPTVIAVDTLGREFTVEAQYVADATEGERADYWRRRCRQCQGRLHRTMQSLARQKN